MGKKRTRSTKTSKGERKSIVNGVKEVRQGLSDWQKLMNKHSAWRKGQNPWITIDGSSSDKRFVRVRANNVWGDPKRRSSYSGVKDDG